MGRPRRSARAPLPAHRSRPGLPALDWSLVSPALGRAGARRLAFVRVDLDLVPAMEHVSGLPLLGGLQDVLREAEVTEEGDLLSLAAGALRAFEQAGFRQVDHWEVRPGGWLPLHRVPTSPRTGTVGHLIAAMRFDEWRSVRGAREFAARLSAPGVGHAEFSVRRVHRERRHSLTLGLAGAFGRSQVERVVAALAHTLPVLYAAVSAVQLRAARASAGTSRHRRAR